MSRSSPSRPPGLSRWRLAAAIAAAVLVPAAVVAVSMWPAQAASVPTAGGVYTIVPGASGKCVEVLGGSTANSALLTQAACVAGATRQQWRVTATGSVFQLVNVNSSRCVDVPSGAATSGLQLQQWGCAPAQTNQQWTFAASSAAAGKYRIASVATGLCVSDKDGSTAGNNPIVQEGCSDIARMQFAFNLVGGSPTTTAPPTTGTPTVASDGTGTYRTVQAAIDAVPANNTSRRTITIKAGTYREIVTIPSNKPFVTLQGVGAAASNTVIANNHSSAGGYGTSGSATVFVNGRDFIATNLTISNDYGEGSQAVAANVNADRTIFNNVRFLGNQDTLLVNSGRQYYVNSYVEGTVDFIFGGATAVFNNSQIREKRSTGGPITAANTAAGQTYGILFYRCTITGAGTNNTTLGRPWGAAAQVTYRESNLSTTVRVAQPWQDWGTPALSARYSEYRNTGGGATVNSNRPQLSDSQAANYTPQRYLAGSDGWNPV